MTLFICHNCSNINSPAGEACLLIAPHDRKDEILRGCAHCLLDYQVPVPEEIRKDSIMIFPDEWDFNTDFYIVESDEARCNFKKVLSNQLWEVHSSIMRPYSNEETLWQSAEEQIFKYKQGLRNARRIENNVINETKQACVYMERAKPCTIETDPLHRRWARC